MEDKNLSELESLSLIQQMIQAAKKEQKDDGRGWIVWGWMLFSAAVFTALNIRFRWTDNTFFFWNLFGLFTILYFIYEKITAQFFKKRLRVKTYTNDLLARLNSGFFISLLVIIVSINWGSRAVYEHYGSFYPGTIIISFGLLVNLYAFWILIYGTALNFRPSIIAAYITWAIGLASLFAKTFEQCMLLHALAVLIGYIIPGHIARREFKKLSRKESERV